MIALDKYGLSRCPLPKLIFDGEYEDDDSVNLDDDQFLKQLSGMYSKRAIHYPLC